jgi:hypothetical protein
MVKLDVVDPIIKRSLLKISPVLCVPVVCLFCQLRGITCILPALLLRRIHGYIARQCK